MLLSLPVRLRKFRDRGITVQYICQRQNAKTKDPRCATAASAISRSESAAEGYTGLRQHCTVGMADAKPETTKLAPRHASPELALQRVIKVAC